MRWKLNPGYNFLDTSKPVLYKGDMIKSRSIKSIFKILRAVLEGVSGNGRRVYENPITSRAAFRVLG